MDREWLEKLLKPYNPWWGEERRWQGDLPSFERPIVQEILSDLKELKQAISVTGPRRVGKSTAVRQVIANLIDKKGINPRRVLYFSFDDPEVFASAEVQHLIFDALVENYSDKHAEVFFFLDEIQRLPRWELYLKKHYDLKSPVRFTVSGSASSPIFRSSQESLLGRIKDRHLLPFSFREYCLYKASENKEFSASLAAGPSLKSHLLNGDGKAAFDLVTEMHSRLLPFNAKLNSCVMEYCKEGGFPEVWSLNDPVRKIEYLMEQHIRKVLYEDLMMLTQYRKPENVLRFFVYLLGHPGIELNTSNISKEMGLERRVIEENLPRLELTDLIFRISRFSHQPMRVRQGNFKCYPIDMALRNAVMKTWSIPDSLAMGYLAENMVFRELSAWPDKIELSYYREKDFREVDFIVTFGGNKFLPIEVKSRDASKQIASLRFFMKKYSVPLGVVITREQEARFDKILYLPMRYFLLAK